MNAPRQPAYEPSAADELRRSAVLIVEDERVARRALATLLGAYGYETAAAGSAEEALEILRRRQAESEPQIALVDLNLPGMNGLEFISQLERMKPGVFPVLMTASAEDFVGEAVRDRNLAYLRKPLDLGQLLTVITHGEDRH
jgi:CheY-like chemotaxis protein